MLKQLSNVITASFIAVSAHAETPEPEPSFKKFMSAEPLAVQVASRDAEAPPNVPANAFLMLSRQTYNLKTYDAFCERYPAECEPASEAVKIRLTRDVWKFLNDINRAVNEDVKYITDREQYGIEDHIEYPSKQNGWKGDCEDYSVLKRKLLSKHIPSGAMMMAFVHYKDEDTSEIRGHSVLVISTVRGDIVLDNRHDDIKLAKDVEYKFVAVQDPSTGQQWRIANQRDRDSILYAYDFAPVILPLGREKPKNPVKASFPLSIPKPAEP